MEQTSSVKDLRGVRSVLRAGSRRVTAKRMTILKVLTESDGHLSIEELHKRARREDNEISLATVYRTLTLFKELAMVEPRYFDEGSPYYELKPYHEHGHLTCLGCGAVVEFHDETMEAVAERIAEQFAYRIADTGFYLKGYCPRCRVANPLEGIGE